MLKILHQGAYSLVGQVGREGTQGAKRPPLRDCVRGEPKELWERSGASNSVLGIKEGF